MGEIMKAMEHSQEMVANEIDKLYRKGDMTEAGLKALYELLDIAKDASIVMAMHEESNNSYGRMPYMYGYGYDDYAMARRGRDGDGDGRYNEGRSNRRSYNTAYDDGKNEAIKKLERKMQEARDDREREMIRSMIRDLE